MGDSANETAQENCPNNAYADAVQRAKQLAAKIGSSSSISSPPADYKSAKRSLEDDSDIGMDNTEPDAKRLAGMADPFASMRSGLSRAGPGSFGPMAGMMPMGPIMSEDIYVPDKMVGLVIGRGGEQVSRIQAETGVKIQMAPDSNGMPDRTCTLTGTRESITRARDMINLIVQTRSGPGAGPPVDPNGYSAEVAIPGQKVGLIIGKGGETIRQLQERSGTRMIIIQEGPQQENEKPLRIIGEPQKVEHAKQLIYELLAEKDADSFAKAPKPSYGSFSTGVGGGQESVEVPVPRSAVGVVIGKSGEMIKKIQSETGAHVQFQQGREDGPGDRMCTLVGSPAQVQEARSRIEELIESVMARDGQMGRGRGRGGPGAGGMGMNGSQFRGPGGPQGGGGGGPGNWGGDYRAMGMARNGQDKTETNFQVPLNKTGLIIGKGGETIRQINMQSGAFCELDRRPGSNPNEKMFLIRGTPEQIETAKRMMCEKVGIPYEGPMGGTPSTQYPGLGQGTPAGYAPQNWGNSWQGQWQGQPNDPSSPTAADANAAAWAAYYQYYGQSGGQAQGPTPTQAPAAQNAAVPINPQTGAPDYSAQWVEYYRSMGMSKEAEALEQQMKANKNVGGAAQGGPTGAAPGGYGGQAYPAYGGHPGAGAPAASGYYGAQGAPGGQPTPGYPYQGYGYGQAPSGEAQH